MSRLSLPIISAMPKAALGMILEADFQAAVVAWARGCNWQVGFTKKSAVKRPDGSWEKLSPSGEPDLRLAKAGRNPVFWELKTEKGTLRPEQKAWLEALGPVYGRMYRPRDAKAIMDELGEPDKWLEED